MNETMTSTPDAGALPGPPRRQVLRRAIRALRPEFVLLLISVALRLYIYAALPPASVPSGVSYPDSLRHHLAEYLWRNTLIPPMTYALHAIPVFLLGIERNAGIHGFLLLTFCLDLLAVFLVYRAIVLVGGTRPGALVLSLLYSAALIPFEIWRSNYPTDHYDHHTILFASLFIFSCLRVSISPDRRHVFLVCLASTLFILQSSLAAYLVPLTLLVLVACTFASARERDARLYRRLCVIVLIPISVVLLLRIHESRMRGTEGSGARSSAAWLMFVQKALNYDTARVRQLATEIEAPQWYLWCYDQAKSPISPD